MATKRKQRVWEWCKGGDGENAHLGFELNEESRKLSLTPEKRKVRYVRCPICGRKLEVLNRECHDFGCVHQYVPKHKART